MGWNGSDRGINPPTTAPSASTRCGRGFRFVLAFSALVLVTGIAAVFWFNGRNEPKQEETVPDKTPKSVAAVAQPSTNTQESAQQPKKNVVRWRGKEYPMYDARGGKAVVTGYGVRYLTPRVITNSVESAEARIPWEARQFKHRTDQEIAVLLNTEPGTAFVGDYVVDKKFNEKFLKSLTDPIVVEEGDSPDVKELKLAVIDARNELKSRYDAGEDPSAIIEEVHKELRELGAYKASLEKLLLEIARKPDMTEKDLDDYVTAANEMLESRGCSKLSMPHFIRQGARLRALKKLQNKVNE